MRSCPEKREEVRTGSHYKGSRAFLVYEGAKEFGHDLSSLSEEESSNIIKIDPTQIRMPEKQMTSYPERREEVKTDTHYERCRALLVHKEAKEFRRDPPSLSELSEEVWKTWPTLLETI